jgi:hypothetical protein
MDYGLVHTRAKAAGSNIMAILNQFDEGEDLGDIDEQHALIALGGAMAVALDVLEGVRDFATAHLEGEEEP